MATLVDTSTWGPTGPRLTGGPASAPRATPPAVPTPPLGTYPLPPGATWANPAPGYDPTGRPLSASSPSSSATQDPWLSLGQLIAASLGNTTMPPQAAPTIATVPATAPASRSSALGILVVVALGFGAWYWWTHRKKGAKSA